MKSARRRARWTGSRISVLVAAVLLATPAASAAAVTVKAHAPIPRATPGDSLAVVVEIEGDGVDRSVVVAGTTADHGGRVHDPAVVMPLSLPAGSRKRVVLRYPGPTWNVGWTGGLLVEVRAEDDDEVLTQVPVGMGTASHWKPWVPVLGPVPRELTQLAVTMNDTLDVVPVDAAALPRRVADLPSARAWLWEHPRAHQLDSDQAHALRQVIREGAVLVVGLSPEDATAVATLGLDDGAAPDVVVRDDGTLAFRGAGGDGVVAGTLPAVEGRELAVRAVPVGHGGVLLVAGDLDRVSAEALRRVLELPEAGQWRELRRWIHQEGPMMRLRGSNRYALQLHVASLVPEPPYWSAAALLVAFFLVTVPLDRFLLRRAARAGRRSRSLGFRFPAAVVVATACAAALGATASTAERVGARVDFVVVAPWGSSGFTQAIVGRARPGEIETRQPGSDALLEGRSRWGRPPSNTPMRLVAPPDPTRPADTVLLRTSTWELHHWSTRWSPDGVVSARHAGSEDRCAEPAVPADAVAWLPACGDRPERWIAGGSRLETPPVTPRRDRADVGLRDLQWIVLEQVREPLTEVEQVRSVVVSPGAVGPPLLVDGERWTSERSFTAIVHVDRPTAHAWAARIGIAGDAS